MKILIPNNPVSMKPKVIAILVTYYPELDNIRQVIVNLKGQGVQICIVDNSSVGVDFGNLGITVFTLGENKGIAYAQNIGMKWAFEEQGADFVLQMDQDSIPEENLVSKLFEGYNFLMSKGYKVGLIGAQDIDKDTLANSSPKIDTGNQLAEKDNLIIVNQVLSSGSLIPKLTYEIVGGLDERLFIDLVDFEYCWRIIGSDFIVVKNTQAVIYHKLGEGTIKIFGLLSVGLPKPFRHYYSVRNSVHLILHGNAPIYWKVSSSIKVIFKMFFYPLALPQGRERLRFIWSGFRDGIKGRFRVINA